MLHVLFQELTRVRCFDFHYIFRRALGDQLAAAVAALGTQIDQPVSDFDDVEIMFDDEY